MKTKLEKRIEELEKRIIILEQNRIYIIQPQSMPTLTYGPSITYHFHNGTPCYNDPCVFC